MPSGSRPSLTSVLRLRRDAVRRRSRPIASGSVTGSAVGGAAPGSVVTTPSRHLGIAAASLLFRWHICGWLTCPVDLIECRPADIEALTAFLGGVDLTLSGLDAPGVRLWAERDEKGDVVASTGYELSGDGHHALIRSVAVSQAGRRRGRGSALARCALERAEAEGATTAWLFSRRSGPFWQSLGFQPADRDELAGVLADTHQVRLFRQTGQLHREVAWSRPLGPV